MYTKSGIGLGVTMFLVQYYFQNTHSYDEKVEENRAV